VDWTRVESLPEASGGVYDGVTLQIGPKIKAARQRVGLSLRGLGEKTGFSASFLSQVELGQVSPSLSSLARIAQALDTKLSDLVAEPAMTPSPLVRRRQRDSVRSEWSHATLQSLLPAGADERLEVMLIGLEPGGRSGRTPLVHSGKEFAFCVRGKASLTLEGTIHELAEGDSVFYDASRSRQWENKGKRPAEILLVFVRAA
jgi:XRE family transcriptional regulator, regulator of sulfur utilization